jgi:hypothetical protein
MARKPKPPRHEALARVVRPIVEGQIKAFLQAHPNGEEYPGHFVSGIAKRVVHDLCSPDVVERIRLALERVGCGGDAMHADDPLESTTPGSS